MSFNAGVIVEMSTVKAQTEGFLSKQKKSVSHFKNNKRRFSESSEMQDSRARRISFKSYLRELEENEAENLLDDNENES